MNISKLGKVFNSIFKAEFIILIGTVINASATVAALIGLDLDSGTALAGGGIGFIGGILLIFIGTVMDIVALVKGRRENAMLGTVLTLVFISIAINILTRCIPLLFNANYFTKIADACMNLLKVGVPMLTIITIRQLAEDSRNLALFEKSSRAFTFYFVVAVVCVFSDSIDDIFETNKTLAIVFGITYILFYIASYILYLRLLKFASKEV